MATLLLDALSLMLIGMSVVFLFLALLIVILRVQTKIITSKIGELQPIPVNSSSPTQSELSPDVVAAISVAVKQYRNNR
ncbi:OadG family protein [Vibrio sp. SS-MA-C1-2]|uniref:OadG family protein n=1 Tax=Vibrio sp. SS-MA-C1-2 TaxID=2908646 RepID=UPI001F324BB4|nr:OadG family transporter subunit [Vibrio sp. SS-MA-C1-2]UJF19010.1 OadG family protein [Vibrio sp. SS-MA-C1-2]